MDENILKYVPKSKRVAVKDAYHDDDGYWIVLNKGYTASRTDAHCHVIKEDTISELRYQIGGIEADPTDAVV